MSGSDTITPVQRFLSASVGALITSVLVTPLDVVKVRLQIQSNPVVVSLVECQCGDFVFCESVIGLCEPSKAQAGTTFRLNGTLDGIFKILQFEGVTALWRGLSASLVMSVPSTAIYFVGYDILKNNLRKHSSNQSIQTYAPLIAGASARAVTAVVIAPAELVRTRLQSTEGRAVAGALTIAILGVKDMVKTIGFRALWRGLSPTLWRDVPFSALYWMSYEQLRLKFQPVSGYNSRDDFASAFISGSVAGAFAAAVTTPFDVAKTKRQVDSSKLAVNTLSILRQIVQENSWRGLFKGLVPRMMRTAPSCAIMISSFELGKQYFIKQNLQHV